MKVVFYLKSFKQLAAKFLLKVVLMAHHYLSFTYFLIKLLYLLHVLMEFNWL